MAERLATGQNFVKMSDDCMIVDDPDEIRASMERAAREANLSSKEIDAKRAEKQQARRDRHNAYALTILTPKEKEAQESRSRQADGKLPKEFRYEIPVQPREVYTDDVEIVDLAEKARAQPEQRRRRKTTEDSGEADKPKEVPALKVQIPDAQQQALPFETEDAGSPPALDQIAEGFDDSVELPVVKRPKGGNETPQDEASQDPPEAQESPVEVDQSQEIAAVQTAQITNIVQGTYPVIDLIKTTPHIFAEGCENFKYRLAEGNGELPDGFFLMTVRVSEDWRDLPFFSDRLVRPPIKGVTNGRHVRDIDITADIIRTAPTKDKTKIEEFATAGDTEDLKGLAGVARRCGIVGKDRQMINWKVVLWKEDEKGECLYFPCDGTHEISRPSARTPIEAVLHILVVKDDKTNRCYYVELSPVVEITPTILTAA
jgi:hypothetical protein